MSRGGGGSQHSVWVPRGEREKRCSRRGKDGHSESIASGVGRLSCRKEVRRADDAAGKENLPPWSSMMGKKGPVSTWCMLM